MMHRVAIVQPYIWDYRVPFYLALAPKLASAGCELDVFASRWQGGEGAREGLDQLPFCTPVRYVRILGNAYWHPVWRRLQSYDLVIVEQANRALLNYALFASRAIARKPARVAYWGHGATLQQENTDPLRSRLKRALVGLADHWFAYTQLSSDIILSGGYPSERITVVDNSVDTADIVAAREKFDHLGRAAARTASGLSNGPIAVFCSRLYAGKNLGFLTEACSLVHAERPDFSLYVIGDGPERPNLERYADANPWVRLTGALYGAERAALLAAADVMVHPSWVGLSILDGFAAGLPVIAAAFDNHSPEIVYLENEKNGFLTAAEPAAYARALLSLINTPEKLQEMSGAASATARRYSLSSMVENFAGGVLQALSR